MTTEETGRVGQAPEYGVGRGSPRRCADSTTAVAGPQQGNASALLGEAAARWSPTAETATPRLHTDLARGRQLRRSLRASVCKPFGTFFGRMARQSVRVRQRCHRQTASENERNRMTTTCRRCQQRPTMSPAASMCSICAQKIGSPVRRQRYDVHEAYRRNRIWINTKEGTS